MKKFVILLIALIMMLGVTGCVMEQEKGESIEEYENRRIDTGLPQTEYVTAETKRLLPTGEDGLYYDKDTFIVYYYFIDSFRYQGYQGFGFLSPFYSENGKLMKFDTVNEKIVEVN